MAHDDGNSSSKHSVTFAPGVLLRLQYACYLFLGMIAAMLLRGSLQKVFSHLSILEKGCEYAINGDANSCTGEVLVYRISFALMLFFLLHLISVSDLTCCIDSEARVEFQRRFFFAKTIILVLLFIATFWIPNSFFSVYAYMCMFSSALFLLLNVVFLVDFSYQWSDEWGRRGERSSKWICYLLVVAVFSYLCGIAVSVVSFVMYVPKSDCNFNAFALSTMLVSGLVYTVLSVWLPHGSIVPSGIVFLYTNSILFVTLRTDRDAHCNRLAQPAGQPVPVLQMILASLVSGAVLGYSVVSASGKSDALRIGHSNGDGSESESEEDPDEIGHLGRYMFLHGTMMLGSMYLAMLATGWHVSGAGEDTMLGSVNIAFWVRSATVWAAVLLYIWSLLAPYYCCRDRDFGFAVEDW